MEGAKRNSASQSARSKKVNCHRGQMVEAGPPNAPVHDSLFSQPPPSLFFVVVVLIFDRAVLIVAVVVLVVAAFVVQRRSTTTVLVSCHFLPFRSPSPL
ncbi:hypothetical protein PIB30_070553 [Stylosanthes scabra]|uniref:Uncharacterized protein n=1 Tax=Stylosanthes scabra TaxID=79078 RepID=A0ABU6YPC0_9FABA|nr:hypothetical protein [Stylosanthes scabra]